nr:ATP-binding protein [Rothia nasimurium]
MRMNPFRPTAGAEPPQLVGRDGMLDEFIYGLKIRSGAPGLLTIMTGARGIGKTVMLNEAEYAARKEGWVVISETATPGFAERIGKSVRNYQQELGEKPATRRLTGIAVAGVSITTTLRPEEQVETRQSIEELLHILDKQRTGLLITLDEIHAADRQEISLLASWVQHYIRESLPIALVFAGLPAAVSDLLNEGVATFLRRADRIDLAAVPVEAVAHSYRHAFDALDIAIEESIFLEAAEVTGGYPFMIQLVGYHLWKMAERLTPGAVLAEEDARLAFREASRRNRRMVIESALATVSAKDLDFLQAMAIDDEVSAVSSLAERTESTKNTVGNYRARLIAAGLIEPAGYGKVRFTLPGLREYLRSL